MVSPSWSLGTRAIGGLFAALLLTAFSQSVSAADAFAIQIVDDETGRGVPLVELRTVHNMRYYTDSAGLVAFDEPGLMNQRVYFHVSSHGYEFPKDKFGYRGAALSVTPGGQATLKIHRLYAAERLYRVTGAGIYADSVALGRETPLKRPTLSGLVLGSDSVVNAIYKGRVYWFWGDTNRPSYPLGNFHVPGATSLLPKDGGLDPERGVDLEYFVKKDGFAQPTAQLPGQGPTWINGLVVLRDKSGAERMFAKYIKVKPPMKVYERGLIEFNDETKTFEKRAQFDMDAPLHPEGHPFLHSEDGTEYVYFGDPYPFARVRASAQALGDLSQYEAWTCFTTGSTKDKFELDRDDSGRLRYGWKADTLPLSAKLQATLLKDGRLKSAEKLFQLEDAESGKPVIAHRGSVSFNSYRKKWIMILCQTFGTSLLGEIWYAEAPKLTGPWIKARKIVTHEKYSFYNPKQHPMFDAQEGRVIYFEGTYTAMFSGNPDRTPRYNYNQIMYKLDLGSPRLGLPVP